MLPGLGGLAVSDSLVHGLPVIASIADGCEKDLLGTGAGIIEEVGNEVSENRIGERVWVFNAQYERELGTAAEYVCLPSKEAISLPDGVSF